jgi:predicted RNase H-like nuclease
MITLFSLNKTLKYKRKSKRQANDRIAAYQVFQSLLLSLQDFEPRLKLPSALLSRDVNTMKGASLKCYEDLLDSIICAYVAYYCWYWGAEKSQVFGDISNGHIVIPLSKKVVV